MLIPSFLKLTDVMAESGYTEEQVFDLGISEGITFLVVVPEAGACRVPTVALSHFMAGADEYTADKMPEYYSGALSGQWTIKRDRLRILSESWREWTKNGLEIDRLATLAEAERIAEATPVVYRLPLHARLEPRNPWRGGRLVDTDLVTLEEAASMASKHVGTEVTPGDFLRAGGRGEIVLCAICPRTVTMQPCRPNDEPLPMPERSIPTLPLDACRALSNTRQAAWRTLDWFEEATTGAFEGMLCRFTRWQLPPGEADLVTNPENCRVKGYDVHALADAFASRNAGESAPSAPLTFEGRAVTEAYAEQERLKREAGRFTIDEAAEIIERESGERKDDMRAKLAGAAKAEKLHVYEPGRLARYEYRDGISVRTFYEEVFWDDLNKWLAENEQRVAYRFLNPALSEPASPAVTEKAEAKEVPDWQSLARNKACDIIKRERARDLYPPQTTIADEIARSFREAAIVGRGNKPLTGSYIKRHALKGISSEQGKQLSTSPSRGK